MKVMSKARRRVLWIVLNLGSLAGVAWAGYHDGPQWVANLVTFYAWVFLAASLFLGLLFRALRWGIQQAEKKTDDFSKQAIESREKLSKGLSTVAGIPDRLSVPRWLDRIYDWTMALALIGAGWFVVATVWLLGIWAQHSFLKVVDELIAMHWERVEEALGVKL